MIYALNVYTSSTMMAANGVTAPAGYTYPGLDLLGSNVYGNAGLLYPSALAACGMTPPGQGCSLASPNVLYAWQKPVRAPCGASRKPWNR